MPLVAQVTLKRGRYAANASGGQASEAVPSPFRLYCALVAVAGRSGEPTDNAALRWLEAQPAPVIVHPDVLDQGEIQPFLVTNQVSRDGGSINHPGRVNGTRASAQAWVTYRGDQLMFVWPQDPDPELGSELAQLARGVTYLGRVESPVSVEFKSETDLDLVGNDLVGVQRWRQVPIGQGERSIAVPYRGVIDALVAAHEDGEPSWHVARSVDYALDLPDPPQPPIQCFQSLLTFAIVGQKPSGQFALDIANSLRRATIRRSQNVVGPGGEVPEAIQGHNDNVDHVAYLPLLNVGATHSDGRILGLGLAVPDNMDPDARHVLMRAMVDPENPFAELRYHRAKGGTLTVTEASYAPQRPYTLAPQRWMGGSRGSASWATITPLMVDRYPSKGDLEAEVARSVVTAGYPAPEWVEVSSTSFVSGGVRYGPGWVRALGSRPKRPLIHARFRFPEAVIGPVSVGALRFLGGGLCIPTSSALTGAGRNRAELQNRQNRGSTAEVDR